MNLLLDTHTFLWFIDGSNELSTKIKNQITNPEITKYISIASLWEIAIKINNGKLKLDFSFEELRNIIISNGFEILALDFEHILKITNLERIHKDPFDRIIIAQAQVEKLTIITRDANFKKYKVKVMW